MSTASTLVPTMLAAFMASTVECVEAQAIVLAVGVVRGWRSALIGSGVGLLLLVAGVLALHDEMAAFAASIATELWGLFVDDGWLAAGILLVLASAAILVHFSGTPGAGANVAVVAALLAVLGASAARRAVA